MQCTWTILLLSHEKIGHIKSVMRPSGGNGKSPGMNQPGKALSPYRRGESGLRTDDGAKLEGN